MTPTEDHAGVEATAREIVRALHAIPRLKIETPRCIGCQKPWTDDHNHDALHAEWPDDIIMLVKQEVYHYERDTEAEIALIAAALRAAPPSGLTPPREAQVVCTHCGYVAAVLDSAATAEYSAEEISRLAKEEPEQ